MIFLAQSSGAYRTESGDFVIYPDEHWQWAAFCNLFRPPMPLGIFTTPDAAARECLTFRAVTRRKLVRTGVAA
jgi:hypothetical protein